MPLFSGGCRSRLRRRERRTTARLDHGERVDRQRQRGRRGRRRSPTIAL